MKLRVRKVGDEWWILGLPGDPEGIGPYKSRGEAAETKRRLEKFACNENRPNFVTCDRIKK